MRILIQRVRRASVSIGGTLKSAIGPGLLVFVGIEAEDGEEDIEWLAGKLTRLRIFDDENGVMNLDVRQVGGESDGADEGGENESGAEFHGGG